MKIVWIEDNHELLASLIQPLQDDKHEVLIYGSLNDVNTDLDEIASADAIILDIILPTTETLPSINGDMLYSGFRVLKKLLSAYNYSGAVIILSSVLNPLVYERFRGLGVPEDRILRKPVRPSKLYEVVTQALAEN